MIKLHHLNNSRSQRVLWLLEEIGIDYEVVRYERDAKTMLAPPQLRKVHPLGKSPVITDDGITVAESGAIIEYLVDRYAADRLAPSRGSAERLRYTYWLHFAEGSAMPPLLLSLVFSRIASAPMPFFAKPVAKGIVSKVMTTFVDPQLRAHLDFIEAELGRSAWFVGETFSAADIQMSFVAEAFAARSAAARGKPHLSAWLERIHSRPAYQRALERGGPYALLS